MSAVRWLARGDWSGAQLTDVEAGGGILSLAASSAGFARRGVAVVEAGRPDAAQIDATTATRWRRVVVRVAEPVPATAWLRIWTRVETGAGTPPAPDAASGLRDDAPVETPPGVWRAAALDALDARVLCPADGVLWVGLELGGRGDASPLVADVRVESGDDGPVQSLPVAYRALVPDDLGARGVDEGDGLLGRFLGLIGAELGATSAVLGELPALLSPAVTPDRADAPWLGRLAAWVAVDAMPEGDDLSRREAVASAVARHGRRGTRTGLIDEVRRRTGIQVEIVEPLLDASVWRLDGSPATSALGITTGLVEADPGPPVLDATAILDQSMLIAEEDAGLPVHAKRAHRVCVHVPDATPEQIAAVDAVVQHERPAHVWARTCGVTRATSVPSLVGDRLPPAGPRGLANDTAHSPWVDGPGVRIGSARLAGEPTHREGDAR